MNASDYPAHTPKWMSWAVTAAYFAPGAFVGGLIGWFLITPVNAVLGVFFRGFNRFFDWVTGVYGWTVGKALRLSVVVVLVYAGLLGLTYWEFTTTPTGFIPQQDKGYLILNVQLPDSASSERTKKVMAQIEDTGPANAGGGAHGWHLRPIADPERQRAQPGFAVRHAQAVRGANAPTAEAPTPSPRTCRNAAGREVREAVVSTFGAPPVDGLGTTGGFKIIIEDRGSLGAGELQRVSDQIAKRGNKTQGLQGLYNSSGAHTPWLYLDIDRTKCMALGVSVSDVFNTLQVYLGSYYVNNYNEFGRTWQVNVQADPKFRYKVPDILRLQVRNNQGQMVRLATVMSVRDTTGPVMVMRYNLYSAAAITGNTAPGTSSGQAVEMMQQIADDEMPRSMAYDWTELAYLQNQAGNTAMIVFVLAVVFVFLVLAAQYESWKLPLAVILVVPMCLLCSVVGVQIAQMDISIFTQIGFVVLVGLACKNAILIVEFAKQQQEAGVPRWEATVEACKLRLRPILMTSFAFILGVVPLVIAEGAGAEMRRSLGTAVFGGMLGVTLFGVFLTPVFYYVIQWFGSEPRTETTPLTGETKAGAEHRPAVHGASRGDGITDRRPAPVAHRTAEEERHGEGAGRPGGG